MSPRHVTTRRGALKALGGLGALFLFDCDRSGSAAADLAASADLGRLCVLDPNLTKGPYWIDTRLERADLTSDTSGQADPNPRPGLPLALAFRIYGYDRGVCTALSGAQVDVWHCDAGGWYSDVAAVAGNPDTQGQTFLRGYQVTDAGGAARFTTIYPGWYAGRAVHVHVKIRLFDNASNTTTEATTQLFFDDGASDAVYAASAPYGARGARDTRNVADAIYDNHQELLVALAGDPATGYSGTIALGVEVGTISSG